MLIYVAPANQQPETELELPSVPSPSPSNPSVLRSDRAESLSIPPSLPPDGSQVDAALLLDPRTMSNISCLLQSDLPAYELPAIQETSKQTECTTLRPSTSLSLEVMSGNGTVNGVESARTRELQELHDLLEDTELIQFVRIADWTVDDLSILIRAKINDLSWPVIADIIGDDRTVGDCKEIYFRLTLFCKRRRAKNQSLQSIASFAQITRLESPVEPPALASQREDKAEESSSAPALQIVQYQSAVASRPARPQSPSKVSPQKTPAKKTVRNRRGTGSATSQAITISAPNPAAESPVLSECPNQAAETNGEIEQISHQTAPSKLNSEEHPPAARPSSAADNSVKNTTAGAESPAAQTLLSAARITETVPDSLSRSSNQGVSQNITKKVRDLCPPSTSGQQNNPAQQGTQDLSEQATPSQPVPEDSSRYTTPLLPAIENPPAQTTPSQPGTGESTGHMFGSPFNDLAPITVEFPAGAPVIRVTAIDETSGESKNEVPEVPKTPREVEPKSGPSVIELPVGESLQNKEMSSASGRPPAAADSGTDGAKVITLMSKFSSPVYATVRSGEISLSRFPEKLSPGLPEKDLPEQKVDGTSSVEAKSIDKPEFKKPSISKPPKVLSLSTMRPPRSLMAIRDVDDSRGDSSLHGFSWNRNETITRRKKSTKNERSRQSVIRMIRGEEELGLTRRARVDYDGDSFEDAERSTGDDDGEVDDERLDTDATISVPDSSEDEDSEIEIRRANIVKPMDSTKLDNIMRDKDLVSTIVTLRNENNRFSALAHVLSDYSVTERLSADVIEKVYKRATRELTSAADINDREELPGATKESGDDTIHEDGDEKLLSLGESEQYNLLELKNREAPWREVLKRFPNHDEHALLKYWENLQFEMRGSRRQRGFVATRKYLGQVRRSDSISNSSNKKKDDIRRKNSSVGRPAKRARPDVEDSKKKTETAAPSADANSTDNGYLTSPEEGEIIEPATQRTSETKKTAETSQRTNGPRSDFKILLRLAGKKKPESPVSSPPSTRLRWRLKSANHETLSAINQGTETRISGVQNSQGGTTSSPVQTRGVAKKKPETSVSSTPSTTLQWRPKSDNHETLSVSSQDRILGEQDSQGGTTSCPARPRRSVRKRACPSSSSDTAAKRMRVAAPSSSGQTSCGHRGRRVGGPGGASMGK